MLKCWGVAVVWEGEAGAFVASAAAAAAAAAAGVCPSRGEKPLKPSEGVGEAGLTMERASSSNNFSMLASDRSLASLSSRRASSRDLLSSSRARRSSFRASRSSSRASRSSFRISSSLDIAFFAMLSFSSAYRSQHDESRAWEGGGLDGGGGDFGGGGGELDGGSGGRGRGGHWAQSLWIWQNKIATVLRHVRYGSSTVTSADGTD